MRSLLVLCILVIGRLAIAEPMVVGVDGPAIYIDLGAQNGVGEGSVVELLHEVVARDPRTGATLRDRFALGALTIDKSGDRLSVAHADVDLAKRVAVGDHVRLISPVRRFVDPWQEQVDASKPKPAVVATVPPPVVPSGPPAPATDHVALVEAAWQATLGLAPEARIEKWTAFLAGDPKSPYRRAVEQEVASLQRQVTERAAVLAQAASASQRDRTPRIARLAAQLEVRFGDERAPLVAAAIDRVVPGRDLVLSFLVRMPSLVKRADLYVHAPGTAGFQRIALVPDGDANLRGTIERALVRPPQLDWYVAAIGANDELVGTLGSEGQPRVIVVDADVTEAPVEAGRSHIDTHLDYVDFDGKLGKGFDQYYQAELDFGYRFIDPIESVRLGFGTLSGTGGPKDVIDLDPMHRCLDANNVYRCRKVTFSYVYVEFEKKLRPNVAVMIRPQAGLLTSDSSMDTTASRCTSSDTEGCAFKTELGVRGRIRLGAEAGTNLVLGAAFTNGIGTLFEAAYNWRPSPIVPIQLSVQVTDMPVPENFGVRLIGDVGLRKLSWFYPSLRVSYQARDIDHSGVSGGFAMNFDW